MVKPSPSPRTVKTPQSRKAAAPPRRRILVLVNRKSGTVRSRGAEAVQDLVQQALAPHFAVVDIELFDGDMMPSLVKARDAKSHDIIIAGGGDGTLASAAAALMDTDITMGVLPLGTMNLFTQALGFSPRLEEALVQVANADTALVDVGLANGKVFLHQVSFGLQPRMARLRERMGYSSRFTKMLAGARAMIVVALYPKSVRVDVDEDGTIENVTTPLLIASNNLLGAPQNPSLPQRLDGGELGLYTLKQVSLGTILRLARDYLSGRLDANPEISMRTAKSLTITRRPSRLPGHKQRKAILSSMDGEVVVLKNPVSITLKPRCLKVLAARKP